MEVPDSTGVVEFVKSELCSALKESDVPGFSFPDGLANPELPIVVCAARVVCGATKLLFPDGSRRL